MEDHLSVASDLPGNRQELPPAIATIPPPSPWQTILPPHPAITVHGTYQSPTLPPESTSHRTPIPPVPSCTLDKIQKGEYIDFSTLTTKAMFGTPVPHTSCTLEVNPSGDSFAIQPTSSHKRITSFPAWLEAWNTFLAIVVDHNPAKASELIAYQVIITSASRQYPLHYDHSYSSGN